MRALPSETTLLRALHARARAAAAVVRRVIGAPDYERYVAHMAERHPGRPVMAREEFARECLERKYSRPGARCC